MMGTSAPAASGVSWKDYANARFAFRICYPDSLKAGPVSGNGDGRVFREKSGVELRVWGSYGTLVLINGREAESDDASPANVVSRAADFEARSLSHIAYRTVRKNWYVLSGTSKGRVFYLKTLIPDDRWISMQLSYPTNMAPKWNPLVRHIAACFEALPPAQFDPPETAKK